MRCAMNSPALPLCSTLCDARPRRVPSCMCHRTPFSVACAAVKCAHNTSNKPNKTTHRLHPSHRKRHMSMAATRSRRQVDAKRQACEAPCNGISCCATRRGQNSRQQKRTQIQEIPIELPMLPPVAPIAEFGGLVTVFLLHTLLTTSNGAPNKHPWSLDSEGAAERVLLHAYTPRHIALRAFFNHIFKHTGSSTHLLLAAKYVQRLCVAASGGTKRFGSCPPTGLKLTPRALLLACLLIAAKQLDDGTPKGANKIWANVGGMGAEELGAAERECLAALGWELNVSKDEFEAWKAQVDRVEEAQKQMTLEKSVGSERWGKEQPFGCESVPVPGFGSSQIWTRPSMTELEV
ncbi:hypothetical protein BJ742DRAFT_797528 [Cladochytrium replicatum]|nr:hypothetical protein BJ742DRAFT_797528 [Cladochytrium replicatum]